MCQDYYDLPKWTIGANWIIYHIFKPNNIWDVQNLHQDKARKDMTFNQLKFWKSTCWDN